MSEDVISLISLGLFLALALVAWLHQLNKLNDQDDYSVVYCSQLPGLMQMSDGPVRATLLRQSGNLYRELGEFDAASSALDEVLKSLNRAKIDSVMVRENNENLLEIWRAFRNHKGRAEGKKLGGATIKKV